ncbi:MAG: glycosyltransferase [bacterium]
MKKVLLCPLDWGIGHASRCVPVIRRLREAGLEVIIAADNRPFEFLRKEFPDLRMIRFPGQKIRYPKGSGFLWKMILTAPSFFSSFREEHKKLREIVESCGADIVISDNRYGCWHPVKPSVFITHQLEIQVPRSMGFLQRTVRNVLYRKIRHYGECWIPDFEIHRGIAGNLSHPDHLPENAHYIGILSRFALRNFEVEDAVSPSFDLMVMLSGPEPQRSILEEKIMRQLLNITLKAVIVRGITESDEASVIDGHIHIFSHLETNLMQEYMRRSALIVARSGYSTIMDMITLGKPAIFIPTPGQTEQEYLARYLMEKKIFFSMPQKSFDLIYAIELSKNFPGMVIRNDYQALAERIRSLIQ